MVNNGVFIKGGTPQSGSGRRLKLISRIFLTIFEGKMMKDIGFLFFVLGTAFCIALSLANLTHAYTVDKTRSEVINKLCQKQQYDFCKVKKVIYMEIEDD